MVKHFKEKLPVLITLALILLLATVSGVWAL